MFYDQPSIDNGSITAGILRFILGYRVKYRGYRPNKKNELYGHRTVGRGQFFRKKILWDHIESHLSGFNH